MSDFIPWIEVENDERYKKLDPERQKQAKAQWSEDQKNATPRENQNKGIVGDTASALNRGTTVGIPETVLGATQSVLNSMAFAPSTGPNVITRGLEKNVFAPARQALKSRSEQIGEQFSPASQVAIEQDFLGEGMSSENLMSDGITGVPKKLKEAFDSGTLAGPALKSPSTLINKTYLSAVESLPVSVGSMGPAALAGRSAVKTVTAKALASGATVKEARDLGIKAAGHAGGLAGGISEGATGAGSAYNAMIEKIMSMPSEDLAKMPKYQEALTNIDPTLSPAEREQLARETIALEAAPVSAGIAFAADSTLGYFGDKYIGKAAAGSGSRTKSAIAGTVSETPTEALQSAGETFGENLAIKQKLDPDQLLTKGLGEAAIGGGLSGGMMGAGMGAGFQGSAPKPENRARPNRAQIIAAKAKLRKELSIEELELLRQSPEALARRGLIPDDITSILVTDEYTREEVERYEAMLDSAPSDAVRAGLKSSFTGQAMEKNRKTLVPLQDPEVLSDDFIDSTQDIEAEIVSDTEIASLPATEPKQSDASIEREAIWDATEQAEEAQAAEDSKARKKNFEKLQEANKSVVKEPVVEEPVVEEPVVEEPVVEEPVVEEPVVEEPVEEPVTPENKALDILQKEITVDIPADLEKLYGDKTVGPQGRSRSATKVKAYLPTAEMKFVRNAANVPMPERSTESLAFELSLYNKEETHVNINKDTEHEGSLIDKPDEKVIINSTKRMAQVIEELESRGQAPDVNPQVYAMELHKFNLASASKPSEVTQPDTPTDSETFTKLEGQAKGYLLEARIIQDPEAKPGLVKSKQKFAGEALKKLSKDIDQIPLNERTENMLELQIRVAEMNPKKGFEDFPSLSAGLDVIKRYQAVKGHKSEKVKVEPREKVEPKQPVEKQKSEAPKVEAKTKAHEQAIERVNNWVVKKEALGTKATAKQKQHVAVNLAKARVNLKTHEERYEARIAKQNPLDRKTVLYRGEQSGKTGPKKNTHAGVFFFMEGNKDLAEKYARGMTGKEAGVVTETEIPDSVLSKLANLSDDNVAQDIFGYLNPSSSRGAMPMEEDAARLRELGYSGFGISRPGNRTEVFILPEFLENLRYSKVTPIPARVTKTTTKVAEKVEKSSKKLKTENKSTSNSTRVSSNKKSSSNVQAKKDVQLEQKPNTEKKADKSKGRFTYLTNKWLMDARTAIAMTSNDVDAQKTVEGLTQENIKRIWDKVEDMETPQDYDSLRYTIADAYNLDMATGLPKSDIRLSTTDKTGTSIGKDNVSAQVSKLFGNKANKIVSVIESKDDLSTLLEKAGSKPLNAGTRVAGAYYKGKIYLSSDSIFSVNEVFPLIVHEGGHWLRETDKDFQKTYKDFVAQAKALGQGKGGLSKIKEQRAIQAATRRALRKNDVHYDVLEEEALMRFLQNEANADLNLFQQVVSKAKRFLYKHFGVSAKTLNLSGYDMAQIVASDIQKKINAIKDERKARNTELDKKVPKAEKGVKAVRLGDNAEQMALMDKVFGTDDSKMSVIEEELEALGVAAKKFARDSDTQTTNWFTRLFSSPEYYATRDKASNRVLQAGLNEEELKFRIQNDIQENFAEFASGLMKANPTAITEEAAPYIIETDRTGKSFSLRFDASANEWGVFDRNNKLIETRDTRRQASDLLIEEEQMYLKDKGMSRDARRFVEEARHLTSRSLEAQNQDLQDQIKAADNAGLDEPKLDGKKLSQIIVESGDLEGSYFPRIRTKGKYYARLTKEGSPNELITFDGYVPLNELRGDLDNKARALINSKLPAGKKIKELEAQGYILETLEPGKTPADELFDAPGITSAVDHLVSEALDSVDNDEYQAQLIQLTQLMLKNIGNIYKEKGNLSNRRKRSENYSTGYETDVVKALVSHAQQVSAGIAKRATAQKMVRALTGHDLTYTEYLKKNPDGDYAGFRKAVAKRRISPTTQKELYADMRSYISYVLAPTTKLGKVFGYAKALAVLKYLGLRPASAAVNMTNMVMGVPATIMAHTGVGFARALANVVASAGKYTAFRSSQMAFRGVAPGVLAEAQYQIESMAKSVGKALTSKVPLSDPEYDLFEDIHRRGWDQPHFNIEAVRAIQGTVPKWFNSVMEKSMYMFSAAERANRAMTIFSAYQAHKQANPNMEREDLMHLAKHTSDRAHGTYGKAAKPWLIQQAPLVDVAYTFMKFQHNYVLNAVEMGTKYKSWKSSVMAMMAPSMMAGLGATLGFPVLNKIAGGIMSALGLDGDDPEEALYDWFEKNMGDAGERFARHGLAGVAGLNMKGSLAFNSPINSGKLADLGGAPLSVWMDVYEGIKHLTYGEKLKAIEKLAPAGAGGSLAKARRLYKEGYTTSTASPKFYGPDQARATLPEAIAIALTFNPQRLSAMQEELWHERQVKASYTTERGNIMRRYKNYFMTPDESKDITTLDKINERADAYNRRVELGSPRYNMSYLTPQKIIKTVRQSLKPSKVERTRSK